MKRTGLPSFSTLVAFETAAQHQNFKKAAQELHVSPAAISRQVRLLEEKLGEELFERSHRAVRLNSKGEKYLEAVTYGLDHIAEATAQIRPPEDSSSISVGLMGPFASLFLAPRIGDFRKRFPDIELYVVSLNDNPDPRTSSFDVLVRMESCNSSLFETTTLFREVVFPVCSPDYLANNPAIHSARDLQNHNLLSTDNEHWEGIPWSPIDWKTWFEHLGFSGFDDNGIRYSSYQMMVNTVLSGHGICLGWHHLVSDLIQAGSLVRPVSEALETSREHVLMIRKSSLLKPKVKTFKQWLLNETASLDNFFS